MVGTAFAVIAALTFPQTGPQQDDPRIHDIVAAVSADRIESDIRTLVGFGTRNTLSDTLSPTRGIGAARRWIKAEFDRISAACGNCLNVFYLGETFEAGAGRLRDDQDTRIVNVVAVQRGTTDPGRYVIMAGDIDSRISSGSNFTDSAPGANDNASGRLGRSKPLVSSPNIVSTDPSSTLACRAKSRGCTEVERSRGWRSTAAGTSRACSTTT